MKVYTTAADYADEVVIPALESMDEKVTTDQVNQIAHDMLTWHNETNEDGDILVNGSGLVERDDRDFWEVVWEVLEA